MKRLLAAGLALALVLGVGACAHQRIADTDFGLAKGSVFDVATPQPFGFDAAAPRIAPPSGMPPMVPHAIEAYLPLTPSTNACLGCHGTPERIGQRQPGTASATPASHYRTAGDKGYVLDGARYNCTACHAPQANVPALVNNRSN